MVNDEYIMGLPVAPKYIFHIFYGVVGNLEWWPESGKR